MWIRLWYIVYLFIYLFCHNPLTANRTLQNAAYKVCHILSYIITRQTRSCPKKTKRKIFLSIVANPTHRKIKNQLLLLERSPSLSTALTFLYHNKRQSLVTLSQPVLFWQPGKWPSPIEIDSSAWNLVLTSCYGKLGQLGRGKSKQQGKR